MKSFSHTLRVRYHECDAQKVVFNSRYGEYVDVAFGEYMRSLRLDRNGFQNLGRERAFDENDSFSSAAKSSFGAVAVCACDISFLFSRRR